MPLEFIDMNSPPAAAVNCDNQKVMGKEKRDTTRQGLKNQKIDNIEFRKKQ